MPNFSVKQMIVIMAIAHTGNTYEFTAPATSAVFLATLLEESKIVKQFYVSNVSGRLNPDQLGCGGFTKWIERT